MNSSIAYLIIISHSPKSPRRRSNCQTCHCRWPRGWVRPSCDAANASDNSTGSNHWPRVVEIENRIAPPLDVTFEKSTQNITITINPGNFILYQSYQFSRNKVITHNGIEPHRCPDHQHTGRRPPELPPPQATDHSAHKHPDQATSGEASLLGEAAAGRRPPRQELISVSL